MTTYSKDGVKWVENIASAVDSSMFTGIAVDDTYTQGYGWNDIVADVVVRGVGANDPTASVFMGFFRAYEFSASTMAEAFASFHILHDYKLGSPIYLHTHYSPNTSAASGVVRWGFEYTVAKGHQQSEFGTTTTVYVEQTVDTQYRHYIAELSVDDALDGTDIEPDTLILCRVFRDAAHANDTYTGTVHMFVIDAHYQTDKVATKNKSPNFYE